MLLGTEFYQLVEAMIGKTTKRRVSKARKAKKCVRTDCNEPQKPGGRGLCKCHSNKFDYARKLAKKAGRAALRKFEREEVKAGRVLPSRRGCSDKNDYKVRAIECAG